MTTKYTEQPPPRESSDPSLPHHKNKAAILAKLDDAAAVRAATPPTEEELREREMIQRHSQQQSDKPYTLGKGRRATDKEGDEGVLTDDDMCRVIDWLAELKADERASEGSTALMLPSPDTSEVEAALLDPEQLQRTIARVTAKMVSGQLDAPRAKAILWALQTASINLRNLTRMARPPAPRGRPTTKSKPKAKARKKKR